MYQRPDVGPRASRTHIERLASRRQSPRRPGVVKIAAPPAAGEVAGRQFHADVERARGLVAKADFFGLAGDDQRQVHRRAVEILRRELSERAGFRERLSG